MTIGTLMLPLFILRPFDHRNGYLYIQTVTPICLWILGIKLHLKRKEHKFDRPCVVVANHQHTVDVFLIGGTMPPATVTIGKKSIKWIPIFGQLYWLADHILLDRFNQRRAFATMDAAKEKFKQGVSIAMFPEGTRRLNEIGLFKKGAFRMAIQAQVPIRPFVISSLEHHLDMKNKWFAGHVYVEELELIETEGKTMQDIDELCERTRNAIVQRYEELNQNPPH